MLKIYPGIENELARSIAIFTLIPISSIARRT